MLGEHELPVKMFLYNRDYAACKNIPHGTVALLTDMEVVTALLQEKLQMWEWCTATTRNCDFLSKFWVDAIETFDVEAAERQDKERREVPSSEGRKLQMISSLSACPPKLGRCTLARIVHPSSILPRVSGIIIFNSCFLGKTPSCRKSMLQRCRCGINDAARFRQSLMAHGRIKMKQT